MKNNLFCAAAFILLSGLVLLSSASRVFAAPDAVRAPAETPLPSPSSTPLPAPAPENDRGGSITKVFKVMFDASTLKEAIVSVLNAIFEDALDGLTAPSSTFYQLGEQISRFVFETPELKEIRLSSWVQTRKVAFAHLPLTAALPP